MKIGGRRRGLAEGIEDFILTDGNPADITQLGISLNKAPARWYSAMSDKIDRMQAVEQEVAGNIVARSQVLRRGAEQSALFSAVLTTIILFLVLIATLAVARSLVPAQPVADRAAGTDDRLPGAERGRSQPALQPLLHGPPGHQNAGTRRTCSCWPGTRPRASGANRCRSRTWSGRPRRRSSSTAGWR
jgi:hypothetical protein